MSQEVKPRIILPFWISKLDNPGMVTCLPVGGMVLPVGVLSGPV